MGQDQLLEFHDFHTGKTFAVAQDHRNNVVALLDDATGTLDRVMHYTPEGLSTHYDDAGQVLCDEEASLIVTCTELNMPFGFNGMWRSNTTGLSHMRNRWYSPQLGQFMSHDPLEYIDSYDLYAFAKLDPINFWDPWGLSGGSLAGTNGTGNSPSGKGRPPSGKGRGGVGGAPNLSPGRTSGCDKACRDKIPDFTSLKPGSPAKDMPAKVKINRELLEQLEDVQNPDYEVSGEIHRAPDGLLFPIIIHRELQEEINPDLEKNHSLPPPDVRAVIAALMPNRDLLFPLGTPVAYFHTHPRDSNISGADAFHAINSSVISVIVGSTDTSVYVPTDASIQQLNDLMDDLANGKPIFKEFVVGTPEGKVKEWFSVTGSHHTLRYRGSRGNSILEREK